MTMGWSALALCSEQKCFIAHAIACVEWDNKKDNKKAALKAAGKFMVDCRGLEPRTLGLRVPCSTN